MSVVVFVNEVRKFRVNDPEKIRFWREMARHNVKRTYKIEVKEDG